MSLLWSQLAGWHIMHSCKVDGLRRLAAQLRLSVTDFCFVDDNPAECAAVMAAEPATHVLHVNPNDEDSLSGVVRRSWLLDVPSKEVTSEDLRRARMHHEQRERNSFLASEAGESSASKLLHTLMVELSFLSDGALDCGRIAQLSERTNQFNSSGRTIILTPGDVDRYRADGGSCIAVQVAR
jgi:FkbH-like protein